MNRKSLVSSSALLVGLLVAGCSSPPRTVASAEPPGTGIVSFPNSIDRTWTTVLLSHPGTTQAGVDGRILTIQANTGAQLYGDELTIDLEGNVGIRGTLFSRSSRSEKKDIRPYRESAIGLLNRVDMVTYHYKNEADSTPLHVGFVAEDAPDAFVGKAHDSFNINNSVAITMRATQELDRRIVAMQREIDELKRALKASKSSR